MIAGNRCSVTAHCDFSKSGLPGSFEGEGLKVIFREENVVVRNRVTVNDENYLSFTISLRRMLTGLAGKYDADADKIRHSKRPK